MRILFSVNNFGFLRNFEPALRELAARGHDVHLLAERKDAVGGARTIENLQHAHPDRITWSYAPSRRGELWQPLATQLRLCLDAWRYLDPRWDTARSLRARAARQAPPLAWRIAGHPWLGSRGAMAVWRRLFDAAEHAMPPGRVAEAVLREHKPDLLLLTPLLYFGSQQVEYVRAARRMGIRTVLGVGSWDHLTTKGLIHEQPGRVIVWNEMQRQEAVDLHGVVPDRVTVTGAQAYDHWFLQKPSTTREAFSARVGIPAERPLLLYLCSSPFIAPYEVGFVRRWVTAIRASSDSDLRRAAILVRPHPQNAEQWRDVDLSFDDALGVWPRAGANPVDTDARAEYYDSMFHSAAVVGVNTSALIESGIVGRPVFTVASEEFSGQQDGTLHFQHLKNVNGGLLTTAGTLDEHVAQLATVVRAGASAFTGGAFIEAFIRPHGLDVPAAGLFADAIEAELRIPAPGLVSEPATAGLRRALLYPAAVLARRMKPRRKATADDKDAGTPSSGKARILFVLSSPEYLRYYDTTMKLLADRGHQVLLAVNALRERKHARLDLVDDERIQVLGTVAKRIDTWTPFVRAVRGTIDFVRYLHPRFAETPLLRARMYRKVLPPALRPLNRIHSLGPAAYGRAIRLLQACERAAPVSARVVAYLTEQSPDAVIVSPLVDAGSDQVDVIRAAQSIGVPVAAAIASWDNLTNKGHMRVVPDMVTVWNEHQRDEAQEFHGVPAARVVVTGAQPFDRWFDREPSQPREGFCAMVGLPDARPFVLFTGSSVFIARSEVEVPFVRRWIEALRASSDPALREAAVLVRPHPFNADSWTPADFSDLGPVAIWPRGKFTPADEAARTSLFDSLYFSAAVVGINTSAMIEAAILRKPVLSLLTPEFAGTQEGTLHFHYLLPENGGFLRIANTLDAHVAQLSEVLHDPESTRAQTERFVERFLRPHGLHVPAAPLLADAFERLAREEAPALRHETIGTRILRAALWPLAFSVRWFGLDQDWRIATQRWAYRTWANLGKTSRLFLKRAVLRPLRFGIWWAAKGVRTIRRVLVLMYRLLRRVARAVVLGSVGLVRLPAITWACACGVKPSGAKGRMAGASPEPRAAERPLRILFSMRNFWYVKLFESVVRELASRGHHVHVLAERGEHNEQSREWNDAAAALAEAHPTVTFAWAPRQVEDDWADLRVMIRLGLDHLRFLEPEYADAPMLGVRARRRTPPGLVRLADAPLLRTRLGRRVIAGALRAAERAVPTGAPLVETITSHHADVVLVTPLLTLGSEQVDVLRTARALGLPSALCVGSWDHLSSKALIRQWPDRVLVWNETQAREAETLHHVPRERVVVTGAQCFDQWFDRRPALDREAFCRKVGLDPARPYVLYVCSALFEGSPNEAEFARRWVAAVRASDDPRLRDAGILVRPHPKRGFEWDDVSLSDLDNVALWPPRAAAPFDAESKSDYFDSMFHSAVIAGLNSSALIEGGIVGRPVHTVLLPEFQQNQEGTLHFHYLLDGGLLRTARDLPSHVQGLAGSLAESDPAVHHNRAFIEQFVRPAGLERAATPIFAGAVEQLASLRTEPQPEPRWVPWLRVALMPLARRTLGTFADQIGRERRRLEKARARTVRIETIHAQRAAEKIRIADERAARREAEARAREAALQQAREAKLRAKEEARAAKRRAHDARLAESRRRKRRLAWHERIAAYIRRMTRSFTASR